MPVDPWAREKTPMPVARTLLVDDSAEFRRQIKAFLASDPDIEVVGEAVDGLDAIRQTRQLKPDLILMDVSMPGTNGIDATRQITSEMPETCVIVLTGHDLPEYREAALSSGASGYVVKKALIDALLPVIAASQMGIHTLDSHSRPLTGVHPVGGQPFVVPGVNLVH